ncbi:MAG: Calx-beta domain-containing protein, partial [Mariprofundaceae bacterium]
MHLSEEGVMFSWLKVLSVLLAMLLAGCNNNSNTADVVEEEAPPVVLASMLSLSELTVSQDDAGMVSLSFKAMLDKVAESDVTADYLISSNSVTTTLASRAVGDDINDSFTISMGTTETTVTIVVGEVGGDTSFSRTVSNVQGATLAPSDGIPSNVTFVAPIPPVVPVLSISGGSVSEGYAGYTTLSFTITLDQATTVDVAVDYTTGNISAIAGSDYVATSDTLTIPAGETTASIDVNIIGDRTFEGSELLRVTLSNPLAATIGTASATGTIANDDAAPPPPPP